MTSETKQCQNCKKSFIIEPDDFAFYEKMQVPPPTFCHLCRAQRRMAYRNERALFKRTSSLSGETIFSTYPADVPFPVYTQNEWFSDSWDPLDYGREYDFNRPFFEQFKELSNSVPKPAKSAFMMGPNTDYSNNANDLKNCYLVFASAYSEDCAYGTWVDYSNNCFDNTMMHECELAYGNFNSGTCSRIFFSSTCAESTDIWFSKKLRNCNFCFGCVNLRNKSYCIFNQQYTKEEYFEKMKEFDTGSYRVCANVLAQAEAHWLKYPNKYINDGTKSVDVTGEYVYHSKNVKESYWIVDGEDLRYCQMLPYGTKSCYDHTVYAEKTELTYECAMLGDEASNCRFCFQTWTDVRDLEYCEYAYASQNSFGCVGIKKAKYRILNKQYSKEEYEALVPKIRAHMNTMPFTDRGGRVYRYGEFFPIEFSPFGYNETIAQEHGMLTKKEIQEQGYNWKDIADKEYMSSLDARALADYIKDVDDSILKETIACLHAMNCNHGCTSAFRIISQELQFLKRFNLPLPRLCVSCRHYDRLRHRNPMRLYKRSCQCSGGVSANGVYINTAPDHQSHRLNEHCPNQFETSYAPDRKEIVYCEACYQEEAV